MTQAELCTALKTVGVPVAYAAFEGKTEPPFITYVFKDANDLVADDANYVPISTFDIELYSDKKDLAVESLLQAALKGLGLVWAKTEVFIATERLIEVIYSVQIL